MSLTIILSKLLSHFPGPNVLMYLKCVQNMHSIHVVVSTPGKLFTAAKHCQNKWPLIIEWISIPVQYTSISHYFHIVTLQFDLVQYMVNFSWYCRCFCLLYWSPKVMYQEFIALVVPVLYIHRYLILHLHPKWIIIMLAGGSLQWCHNEHDGVSNHWHLDCLLNHLYRCRSYYDCIKQQVI